MYIKLLDYINDNNKKGIFFKDLKKYNDDIIIKNNKLLKAINKYNTEIEQPRIIIKQNYEDYLEERTILYNKWLNDKNLNNLNNLVNFQFENKYNISDLYSYEPYLNEINFKPERDFKNDDDSSSSDDSSSNSSSSSDDSSSSSSDDEDNVKPVVKPDIKPDIKPVKPDIKPVKPDIKPVVKPDIKPVVKPDVKPDIKKKDKDCKYKKKPECLKSPSTCEWVVGKGCINKPTDKPTDKPTVKPIDKPTVKPIDKPTVKPIDKKKDKDCRYKKKPECLESPSTCEWVVGKGCKDKNK